VGASHLQQVGGFLWVVQFPPSIKLTVDITEIIKIKTKIRRNPKLEEKKNIFKKD
jgi:hypothetical protein